MRFCITFAMIWCLFRPNFITFLFSPYPSKVRMDLNFCYVTILAGYHAYNSNVFMIECFYDRMFKKKWLNTFFVSSHTHPENPEETQVIEVLWTQDMICIRVRHCQDSYSQPVSEFRHKCTLIPLDHVWCFHKLHLFSLTRPSSSKVWSGDNREQGGELLRSRFERMTTRSSDEKPPVIQMGSMGEKWDIFIP